ncbi:hypothetical protein HDU81_000438 [Chytriomyces hyalinus]|nr:hypothetical protein HDU81_000438 [Chytriomyces hyalinus]
MRLTASLLLIVTASLANAINIRRMGHLNHHFSKQDLDNVSGCRFAASFDGSPSCQQVADLNNMSLKAFQAINRNLDCSSGSLPDGALVCIGVAGAGGVVPNVKPLPTFDTDSESDSNSTLTMTAVASGTVEATSAATSVVSGSSATVARTSSTEQSSTTTTTENARIEKTIAPTTTTLDEVKTKESFAPVTSAEEIVVPSPSPSPKPPSPVEPSPEPSPVAPNPPVEVPAPSPTQQPPKKDTGDSCGYIISLANSYGSSSSASDALRLHNEIRAYVSSVKGISLSPLSWSDAVAGQATADAIWSVGNSNCAGGALAYSPEWSNGVHAKSLGWSNFMFAIQQFVSYDDGGGSECAQWFANPGIMSHFGNIVSDSSSMGCGLATCPGGQFGPVVGCDYA